MTYMIWLAIYVIGFFATVVIEGETKHALINPTPMETFWLALAWPLLLLVLGVWLVLSVTLPAIDRFVTALTGPVDRPWLR